MKAVVYKDAYHVAVEEVPDPRIEDPQDVIIQITTSNICGSDLHMYEGRTNVERGKVLGHENMGIVTEVGSAVKNFRPGDRVSVPFNVACGTCANCLHGWTSFCLRANPVEGVDGGAYGYASMGPYEGGQAEYLRVPWADFNLLPLPQGSDFETDFTMLSDIFPTAYFGTDLADVRPGDTVAVYGAGPVGLLAAHSAYLRGAARVFSVDTNADRLRLAQRFGATRSASTTATRPSGYSTRQAARAPTAASRRSATRRTSPAGGNAGDSDGLAGAQRARTGRLGVVGVYLPQDPGAATEAAKDGRIGFDFGSLFQKGLTVGTGQCPVKRFNEHLRDLIIAGRAKPSTIVSHELPLAEAPDAYEKFDKRVDGYTKVLLHPAA